MDFFKNDKVKSGVSFLNKLSSHGGKVSVMSKVNIKLYEGKNNDCINKIKESLGFDSLKLEVDWLVIEEACNKSGGIYLNKCGECVSNYLSSFADTCYDFGKDELTKEAFEETVGKKVVLKLDVSNNLRVSTEIAHGLITILLPRKNIDCQINGVGKDLEDKL